MFYLRVTVASNMHVLYMILEYPVLYCRHEKVTKEGDYTKFCFLVSCSKLNMYPDIFECSIFECSNRTLK